jgi:hypothetical protein
LLHSITLTWVWACAPHGKLASHHAALQQPAHAVVAASLVQIGDGDCGSTLAQGAAAIHQQLAALPWDDPALAALALAGTLGRSMGGTSGAVVSCTGCLPSLRSLASSDTCAAPHPPCLGACGF